MPKLFCCSDIHSAYTPWMKALDEAGFDENNPEHKIIVCGDLFDRMDESQQVYEFAKEMLEKDRMIYCKGNHEQLMLDLIERKYAQSHDVSNGTFKTIIDLAPTAKDTQEACMVAYEKLKPLFDKMVNYVETEHFVFCHSWVPVNVDDNLPMYYKKNRKFSIKKDWRYSHQSEWDDAAWLNPLDMAMSGFGIDKTICSGHWHSSKGWAMQNGTPEFGEGAIFKPFYYEEKLIMIDAATAVSHRVNCLVIEDEFI